MSDDLPRKKFEIEKLRYQWYTGYDREREYEKDPQWAIDMGEEEIEEKETDHYSRPEIRFFDRYDPEHMWISSDTTYNLMSTL